MLPSGLSWHLDLLLGFFVSLRCYCLPRTPLAFIVSAGGFVSCADTPANLCFFKQYWVEKKNPAPSLHSV